MFNLFTAGTWSWPILLSSNLELKRPLTFTDAGSFDPAPIGNRAETGPRADLVHNEAA
jgi:hypothetical protein